MITLIDRKTQLPVTLQSVNRELSNKGYWANTLIIWPDVFLCLANEGVLPDSPNFFPKVEELLGPKSHYTFSDPLIANVIDAVKIVITDYRLIIQT